MAVAIGWSAAKYEIKLLQGRLYKETISDCIES
jgi:hypothetical protein